MITGAVRLLEQNQKAALFLALIISIFIFRLTTLYYSYNTLTEYPYAKVKALLLNQKERIGQNGHRYFILYFRGDDFDFKTLSNISRIGFKNKYTEVTVDTSKLSFTDFLKGAKLPLKNIEPSSYINPVKQPIEGYIRSQHVDERLQELYLNLFLNYDVGGEIDDFISIYGLGAFFAISGLNVALIAAMFFIVFGRAFLFFQDRFFPYANRNLWILSATFLFLLFFAYLTDFTPSFMRAIASFAVIFYFGVVGFKLFGYGSLLVSALLCFAFFPEFVFSIGFWLSFYGVFLIYLFLNSVKIKNKVVLYVALNVWLFFSMSPVLHYLFSVFTVPHLLNPVFAAIFDIFYPVSFAAHIFGFGGIFDDYILEAIISASSIQRYEFFTPLWFFIFFTALSFGAVFYKRLFVVFNITSTIYTLSALWFLVYG